MPQIVLKIEGIEQLRTNFKNFPDVTKKYLNRAIQASVFEIQKNADDSGDSKLFEFRTPRAQRTGMLALSFIHGVKFRDLYAEIGPTVNYAYAVYTGVYPHFNLGPNPYMDRIAKASEPNANKYFAEALTAIIEETSK